MENNRRRNPRKYLITFFLVFAVTCTVLIVSGTRAKLRTERTAMSNRAEEFSNLVTSWFRETQDTLQIIDYEATKLGGNIESSRDEMSEVLNSLNGWSDEFSDSYVFNPKWKEPLITRDGLDELPEEISSAYHGALEREGGIFITSPYMAKRYNVYCVTLSKAVYDSEGELICVACVDCYLDKLIGILGGFYTDKSYAFLADEKGNIINHPYAAYQMRMDSVKNVSELSYHAAFDAPGIHLIQDYDGKYRACLVIRDEKTGFNIFVLESWQTVYGSLLRSIIPSFLTLIAGFVLLWYILKGQTNMQEETTRRLREAAEEAERASNAKSVFLANMSHEIRTPIHSVLGMDEMILKESNQPDILEYASHIRQAGNTLLELINSILDFSKLESEKMELIYAPYSLRELVTGLESMIEIRAREKNLIFIVSVDKDLPLNLVGDEARLRQILLNLLNNAVKYTQKGQVHFSVTMVERSQDDVRIRFDVSDTGVGIREENIDRLGLSFERLDEEHTRNIEGTGLGLAIVSRLLELMDTELEVDSKYGVGSTFSFEVVQPIVGSKIIGDLHVLTESEKQQLEAAPRGEETALSGRILAVDDVEMNLMVLRNFLKGTRLQVDTVSGGEQALDMLRKNSYDLILLDHMMPRMDGMETLRAIREQHLADDVHVIALTANAVSGARQMYLDAGFDGYLSKPITSKDLFAELERHIKKTAENVESRKSEAPGSNRNDKFLTVDMVKEAVPEIDIPTGIAYCGGTEEFFLPLLEEYAADNRFSKLWEFYASDDWENYRILVHSLKSSTLMIGLTELSKEAEEAEKAVKELDIPYLRQNHKALMEHYIKTIQQLRPLFSETKRGEDE